MPKGLTLGNDRGEAFEMLMRCISFPCFPPLCIGGNWGTNKNSVRVEEEEVHERQLCLNL